MSNRGFLTLIIGCIVTAMVLIVLAFRNFGGDGIETGRTYALAYSYKAVIKGGTTARVFDFANRSFPRTSIVVPLYDDRGMPLVRENSDLPPSSVRKIVASVPTRTVEGVTYPGYTYVEWQYHLSVVGPQSVVPVVTPSK